MSNREFWYKYIHCMYEFISQGGYKSVIPVDELIELANCCYKGDLDIPQNINLAEEIYYYCMLKGSQTGARHAVLLNERRNNGLVIMGDSEESPFFQLMKDAAETGDHDSQYNLAVQYTLLQDYDNAFKYYRLSAEQGNPNAMSRLARFYIGGHGCEPNLTLATYWIFIKAMSCKDILHSTQVEIQETANYLKDKVEYIVETDGSLHLIDEKTLIKDALDAGERDAYNLYLEDGLQADERMVEEAVKMGHPYAQYIYAMLLHEKGDKENAMKYLKLACEQKNIEAESKYACLLFEKGDIENAIIMCEKVLNHVNNEYNQEYQDIVFRVLAIIYSKKKINQRAAFCWYCTNCADFFVEHDNWCTITNDAFDTISKGYMYERKFNPPHKLLTAPVPDTDKKESEGCLDYLLGVLVLVLFVSLMFGIIYCIGIFF